MNSAFLREKVGYR